MSDDFAADGGHQELIETVENMGHRAARVQQICETIVHLFKLCDHPDGGGISGEFQLDGSLIIRQGIRFATTAKDETTRGDGQAEDTAAAPAPKKSASRSKPTKTNPEHKTRNAWSDEELARAIKMMKQGRTNREIAVDLGRGLPTTAKKCQELVRKLGIDRNAGRNPGGNPGGNPGKAQWDEQRDQAIRDGRAAGLSDQKIADQLGLSKSQVIGRRHRLEKTGGPMPTAKGGRTYPGRTVAKPKPVVGRKPEQVKPTSAAPKPVPPAPPVAGGDDDWSPLDDLIAIEMIFSGAGVPKVADHLKRDRVKVATRIKALMAGRLGIDDRKTILTEFRARAEAVGSDG